ncbi:MAG: hypothetical protein ABSA93_16695 [Streptosporangiaceae bacterium]|jgi:hypothetical protein
MPEARAARSSAWIGALLGTAGLFMLNLVFGPIAIGLGVTALRRHVAGPVALVAIALGAADVILELVLAGLWFRHGLVWRFGA